LIRLGDNTTTTRAVKDENDGKEEEEEDEVERNNSAKMIEFRLLHKGFYYIQFNFVLCRKKAYR
jgi:hypothetical protein